MNNVGYKYRLAFCRYYRDGEQSFPQNRLGNIPLGFLFWEAEYTYINTDDVQFEQDVINSYLSLVGASTGQTIPLLLCAILFALYCKGADIDPIILAATFKKDCLQPYMTA